MFSAAAEDEESRLRSIVKSLKGHRVRPLFQEIKRAKLFQGLNDANWKIKQIVGAAGNVVDFTKFDAGTEVDVDKLVSKTMQKQRPRRFNMTNSRNKGDFFNVRVDHAETPLAALRQTGNEIHFMNGFFLSRFISPAGKILRRVKTGLNAKQQRRVAKAIKKARNLNILPSMERFLPTFEMDLPNQTMPNPLAPPMLEYVGWEPEPEIVSVLRREFGSKLGGGMSPSAKREEASDALVYTGLDEVDRLDSIAETVQFIESLGGEIADSSIKLTFGSLNEAKLAALSKRVKSMGEAELKAYITSQDGDISDCVDKAGLELRVNDLLQAAKRKWVDNRNLMAEAQR